MQTALIIIHLVITIILIATVLLQHGSQQGISGAIAGGAETFFGKNKGRTVDAMLKKVTAVVAVLFIISSVVLAVYSIQSNKADQIDASAVQTEVVPETAAEEAEEAAALPENEPAAETAEEADEPEEAEEEFEPIEFDMEQTDANEEAQL